LRAGVDDTGSKPKYGSAMVIVGLKMATETAGVPAIPAHVDMTQAGPHGQTAACPEASPGPCSAQISLVATTADVTQEMTRNPDIATWSAIT
jgi:hypothetical protein